MYALAEAHASIITTTTPLLKSFVLKFSYIGANGPQGPKPLFTSGGHGKSGSDEAPGSMAGSNLTEREKATATSSLGGEGRPRSGNNPHVV